MAKIEVDSWYCPEMANGDPDGKVYVWVDTQTNNITTNSDYIGFPATCNGNRLYEQDDLITDYCNDNEGRQKYVYAKNNTPFAYISTGADGSCHNCKTDTGFRLISHESAAGLCDGAFEFTLGTTQPVTYYLNGAIYNNFPTKIGRFENMCGGDYLVEAKFYDGLCVKSRNVTINVGAKPTINLKISHATVKGLCNGSIEVYLTGGNYQASDWFVTWVDVPGIVTNDGKNAKDVCAGAYKGKVEIPGVTILTFTAKVSEPSNDPGKKGDTFQPSPAQALRFVKGDGEKGRNQNMENALFNDIKHIGIMSKCYYQKYENRDITPVQVMSNCEGNRIEVYNGYTGALVSTKNMAQTAVFSNVAETFSGSIRDNGDGSTRVTFDTPKLPVPIAPNDTLEINGSPSTDNIYLVKQVGITDAGTEFVTIDVAYAEASASTNVSITTYFNKRNFDIYEGVIRWTEFPDGLYFVRLKGGEHSWRSEFIDVKELHEGTVLMAYRHKRTYLDMYYAAGFTNYLRVEGMLFHLQPQVKTELHDDNGELVHLSGEYKRQAELKLWGLPFYMHEKIGVALVHSFLEINGQEWKTREGYNAPRYLGRTLLANGDALLVAPKFASYLRGEGTNVDSGNDGGFIEIDNQGLLKY